MLVDVACCSLQEDSQEAFEKSLDLVNQAWKSGVTHLLMTKRYEGEFSQTEKAMQRISRFQEQLDRRGISVVVFPGQILKIEEPFEGELDFENLLYMDLNNRYLLVELSEDVTAEGLQPFLFACLNQEILPVLVGVEKNKALMENSEWLYNLVDQGCCFQISANAYLGEVGKDPEKNTRWLLNQGLVTSMGSFAECARDYRLKQAYRLIAKEYGNDFSFNLQENAKALVNGETVLQLPHFLENKDVHFFEKWFRL